jgi:hypothetical protein
VRVCPSLFFFPTAARVDVYIILALPLIGFAFSCTTSVVVRVMPLVITPHATEAGWRNLLVIRKPG